jgi:hypothetical protein
VSELFDQKERAVALAQTPAREIAPMNLIQQALSTGTSRILPSHERRPGRRTGVE